jgi:hypothetical protein
LRRPERVPSETKNAFDDQSVPSTFGPPIVVTLPVG